MNKIPTTKKELVMAVLKEWPCKWCPCATICTIQCAMWHSHHNYYNRMKILPLREMQEELKNAETTEQVYNILSKYKQYYGKDTSKDIFSTCA